MKSAVALTEPLAPADTEANSQKPLSGSCPTALSPHSDRFRSVEGLSAARRGDDRGFINRRPEPSQVRAAFRTRV